MPPAPRVPETAITAAAIAWLHDDGHYADDTDDDSNIALNWHPTELGHLRAAISAAMVATDTVNADATATISALLDEVYALRVLLAQEAGRTVTDLSYATYPKSRRTFAEASIDRITRAAATSGAAVAHEISSPKVVLRRAGFPQTLTRHDAATPTAS
jgi:hypothetical protein